MKMKKNNFSIFTIIKVIVLLIAVFCTLYPFIYMAAVSTSDAIYVLKSEVSFYPKGFNLNTYRIVFEDHRIFKAYLNTVLYSGSGSLIALAVTCAGAYALSKKKLIFNKFFTAMIMFTMFFGGGMIPTYLTVRGLGLYDTMWAIILPVAVSTYNLLIMRTFFVQFPVELEESGRLDGLNDLGVFFRIALPLSKAVLATILLFYAVSLWNSYFSAMLYINTENKQPLQIVLRDMLIESTQFSNKAVGADTVVVDESLKYSTVIVSIIPIILVYPFLQKYFVKGVMIGSLKG